MLIFLKKNYDLVDDDNDELAFALAAVAVTATVFVVVYRRTNVMMAPDITAKPAVIKVAPAPYRL